MRMNYSMHLTHLMSAIELACDAFGSSFMADLEAKLATSSHAGTEVLGYVRHARNAVVHRGLDSTARGDVVAGVVRPLAPPTVTSQKGAKSFTRPAKCLFEVLQHGEWCTKLVLARYLEPAIVALESMDPEDALQQMRDAMDTAPDLPPGIADLGKLMIEPWQIRQVIDHSVLRTADLLAQTWGARLT